jgi:hypothetical protein
MCFRNLKLASFMASVSTQKEKLITTVEYLSTCVPDTLREDFRFYDLLGIL